ncbi:TRAP-type C4-dicarboxylate transport system permease small subunit [Hoeflea halophila]|uniref:TRAP transporter small permease protein n=1 Tax=Hoeflea halophila TaxID=714899 RepID=A0A286I9M6_9HYPH|nr:TRAP transporter small permease [Hoeflea halophila]SOE16687.1 TRAP-type C4-dicarboxylate transport system permease small subunit [Hoeflea halophila]
MFDRIDRLMRLLAALLAIVGGLALIVVILSTVASVSGRALLWAGLGPIRGDFELVELGTGFAVFAFLPWVQINRQHAAVEILTMHLGATANRVIDMVSDLLMLTIAVLLTWKHWEGTLDKLAYGETTFIIQYPIWWAYASGLVGAIGFVLVSAWCVILSARALMSGRSWPNGETVH